jgi:hypothetical protein
VLEQAQDTVNGIGKSLQTTASNLLMQLLSVADTAFRLLTKCERTKYVVDQCDLPLDENVGMRTPSSHLPHAQGGVRSPEGLVPEKHSDGQTEAMTETPAGSAERTCFREPQGVPQQIENPFHGRPPERSSEGVFVKQTARQKFFLSVSSRQNELPKPEQQ